MIQIFSHGDIQKTRVQKSISKPNTPDQEMPQTKEKLQGINNVISSSGHTYQTIYNNKIAGFTLHTFNEDFTSLTTELITYDGNVIHTFTQDKYSGSPYSKRNSIHNKNMSPPTVDDNSIRYTEIN